MAKKIKKPLLMDGDCTVNTVAELREHFSILRILTYVSEDKASLITFLRDRYENETADNIEALDLNDDHLSKRICEIFNVEYNEQQDVSLDDVKEAKEKREKLLQFTQDEDILSHAADCAFDQNGLYDLLDAEKKTIYLCGESFNIPVSKNGISYVGIKINDKEPVAVINSKEKIDFSSRGIMLAGVSFDEKYREACKCIKSYKPFDEISFIFHVNKKISYEIAMCEKLVTNGMAKEALGDGFDEFNPKLPAELTFDQAKNISNFYTDKIWNPILLILLMYELRILIPVNIKTTSSSSEKMLMQQSI